MKIKIFKAGFVFVSALAIAGCISLPKFSTAPEKPLPAAPVTDQADDAAPSHLFFSFPEVVEKSDPRIPAPEPALRTATPKMTRADLKQHVSESTRAIQRTVNWFATLAVLGGLALLGLGVFLCVNGHVVPGIKFALCGLLLPIFGIWFAYHWLMVAIVALLVIAGLEISAHYVLVAPLLRKIEQHAEAVTSKSVMPFLEKL
jgi:hypothetical protein